MNISVRNILLENQKVKEIIINDNSLPIVCNTDENNFLCLIKTFLKNKEHVLLSIDKKNLYKEGIAQYFSETAGFLFINHVLKNQISHINSLKMVTGPMGPQVFSQISSELAAQVQKLKSYNRIFPTD